MFYAFSVKHFCIFWFVMLTVIFESNLISTGTKEYIFISDSNHRTISYFIRNLDVVNKHS